ncbi:MAG: lipopolysaccharide biosynthesis protein [Chloroflexi bacterium]|nr:lipopolysaccharide biosynthesis protein [Anaerolineaceae bacterium]NMB90141.1 lipopolysaccharide biosynthesis protein [Chloroflexota bacterium]
MKLEPSWWRAWREDNLLQGVIRNTGYLFSSNTISMVLASLQGILAAVLLGPAAYGALGVITQYASTVNRLLSFRMGEVVIKYAGQHIQMGRRQEAAAVIKLAALAEALTSVVAYGLLALTAPLAARWIVKDVSTTSIILLYGLALLANLVTETSTAVLQIGGHFRSQALLTLMQNVLTAAWIGVAYLTHGGLYQVLMAYLAGKLLFGVGIALAAGRWMTPMLGPGWQRAPLSLIQGKRKLLTFAVSTNLSGTINLVVRDSEVLWAGFLFTTREAGYYKFAQAMMNIILMPITPFINTTFPEISRQVAARSWAALRRLLRRTSLVAAVWTAACAAGLLLLGPWVLGWLKDGAYLPSLPGMLVLLAGFGTANVLFWNRPLLLSFGMPNYPLGVTATAGALKTVLMLTVARPFGYVAQAVLLSGYFIVSVGLIVRRGLVELRRAEQEDAAAGLPAAGGEPA